MDGADVWRVRRRERIASATRSSQIDFWLGAVRSEPFSLHLLSISQNRNINWLIGRFKVKSHLSTAASSPTLKKRSILYMSIDSNFLYLYLWSVCQLCTCQVRKISGQKNLKQALTHRPVWLMSHHYVLLLWPLLNHKMINDQRGVMAKQQAI